MPCKGMVQALTGEHALAESLEERGLPEGNPPGQTNRQAQDRERLQQLQGRIRQAAKKDKQMVFTNLWHHRATRRHYVPKPDGGGSDPSAYRRWKRRSYSGRALRCSTRSTRNVSWASAMGSGRDAVNTMRWTPFAQASRKGR